MKKSPVPDPLFPEIPMPGSDQVLPPVGTPPFPDPAPRVNGPVPDFGYERFEQTGSISDYLLYKNQSALQGGGSPFDHQDPGHRFGTDAAQFPGQKTDPAHF